MEWNFQTFSCLAEGSVKTNLPKSVNSLPRPPGMGRALMYGIHGLWKRNSVYRM